MSWSSLLSKLRHEGITIYPRQLRKMHSLIQKDFRDGMKSMNQRINLLEERQSKMEKKFEKFDKKLDQLLELILQNRGQPNAPSTVTPETIITPPTSPTHGLSQTPEFLSAKLNVLSYLATLKLPKVSDLPSLLKTRCLLLIAYSCTYTIYHINYSLCTSPL